MPCEIVITTGLSRERAEELDRHARLDDAPFTFVHRRRGGILRLRAQVVVGTELTDRPDDPSLASETLDHEYGWPQDPAVREWFGGAMGFLGENVPEGFSFNAGWTGHWDPQTIVRLDLDGFLARIAGGELRSDERYDIAPG
jgi:hypothetical protein